jgi:hypothetical protein
LRDLNLSVAKLSLKLGSVTSAEFFAPIDIGCRERVARPLAPHRPHNDR